MSNTIDLDLFNPEPLNIKLKGKEYKISFISSITELTLLNEQEDVSTKLKRFKNLKVEDLGKWKQIITSTLLENKNTVENEIDNLSPLETITLMTALIQYVTKRSEIIYQVFDDDTQKEMKTLTDEAKKKILNKASLE